MIVDPRCYASDELLRDGGSIHIRALRPDDRQRLLAHFQHLSAQSIRFRFLGAKKLLSEDELDRFTELDFESRVALVATLGRGEEEKIIGVGRYDVLPSAPSAPRSAEVAFAVLDEHQGRGIGTVLLEHLLGIARQGEIREFEADVMGENRAMLDVFRGSGLLLRRTLDSGVVHLSFPIEETDAYLEASFTRWRLAAARSLHAFLTPRSVALVGASRRPDSIGGALLANLKRAGFHGAIHLVNPNAREIDGLPSHPSVSAIGAAVDLAVIAVPAPLVEAVVADCARAGVRGVVVISAGFAEAVGTGKQRQDRLTELVRTSGMRMIGPNCMGVLNTAPDVLLNATFAPSWPPAGNIGMLSQSGALGITMLDYVGKLGLGLSTFVSVGNKADVSSNDLLAYWADDPRTRVIVLYLESFGNPRKFARLAPQVSRSKPIIAVKAGRSAAGKRAASSHSAALASLDVAVDALFEQAGVIRTNTLEELFDVAALLATQPVPRGPRVGIVTNAGGPGILLADACAALGLELPEPGLDTISKLRSFLPAEAGLSNPIDMIASANAKQFESAIEAMGSDPGVDSLVVIYVPPLVTRPEEIAVAIARGAGKVPAEKPVLTVFLSSKGAPSLLSGGPRGPLPSYSYPENAAQALGAVVRHGKWRSRPRGRPLMLEARAEARIRATITRVLEAAEAPGWLSPADLADVLEAAGIPLAPSQLTTLDAVEPTAERLGYPLVAKAVAPGVLHKSDIGGVILGLESSADVKTAAETLVGRVQRAGAKLEAILLQREIRGGIEALVGVTSDPVFGPLVVCGLGGVLVEILRDAAFRLSPVTDLDAEEMLASLRSARLLDGYRGALPGDRAALIEVLMRVSALVEVAPEILELDLNPVKVLEPGKGAVVLDARMRIASPQPTGR
ncbi:MAG: GNAT family N-acetyltransferase [Candidatus Limnocylindria bacterium]